MRRLLCTMTRKTLYLCLAIIGALLPWLFFGTFFAVEGVDIPLFVQSLFVNPVAAGFTVDLLLSIGIFWFWSYGDARTYNVRHWWLVLPAATFVGLSLALPLYLYLREGVQAGPYQRPV